VRQTFNDSIQAREWESKVIRRIDAVKNERWLNKKDPKGKFYNLGHKFSDEVKKRMSDTRKRKTISQETAFLIPKKLKIKLANL